LFSQHFGLNPELLEAAGLIDPFVNVDTQLFIDPVLLEKSSHELIRGEALAAFRKHFDNFLRLLAISEREGDAAWRGAQRLLDLSEPPDNGLGYGGSRRGGNSRPHDIRYAIMRTSKEIVTLGSKDPEMLALMGFFEENVGPDTISDFTTRVIARQLAQITEKFCNEHGVPTSDSDGEDEFGLPYFGLNAFLGSGARHTLAERKAALRKTALESADLFELFLKTVKAFATPYNQDDDILGYFKLKELLASDNTAFKVPRKFDLSAGIDTVIEVVHETISVFQHHVERGNLWEALWSDGRPKKERASQLIYFAIADSFCKANNVDISPEANMGGGPIDFKFSSGYEARVLVEMKRSDGAGAAWI
jgi:hypothetical protein